MAEAEYHSPVEGFNRAETCKMGAHKAVGQVVERLSRMVDYNNQAEPDSQPPETPLRSV